MANNHRDYLERWQRINAFQAEESRQLSPAARLQQFVRLLEMARRMHWQTSTPAEIAEVRRRWKKIKECSG